MDGLFIDKSDRFASIMRRIGFFREGPYRGLFILIFLLTFCFFSFRFSSFYFKLISHYVF